MQHSASKLATNAKYRLRPLTCIVTIISIIIVIFLLVLFIRSFKIVPQSAVVIPLPDSDTVITQVRTMGNLETVSYTLEKVIPYDQDANSFWHFLGDRTKLFVVHGEVIAGFDLTKLSKGDVQIQGTKITINLPSPQILNVTIDETKTHIYDVNSGPLGLFTEGLDSNQVLQLLAAAKVSLRADACQGDILQKASNGARQQFTSFLTDLGFKTVIVNIPNGGC